MSKLEHYYQGFGRVNKKETGAPSQNEGRKVIQNRKKRKIAVFGNYSSPLSSLCLGAIANIVICNC